MDVCTVAFNSLIGSACGSVSGIVQVWSGAPTGIAAGPEPTGEGEHDEAGEEEPEQGKDRGGTRAERSLLVGRRLVLGEKSEGCRDVHFGRGRAGRRFAGGWNCFRNVRHHRGHCRHDALIGQ